MGYGIYQNAEPESRQEPVRIMIRELSEQMQKELRTNGNSKNQPAGYNLKEDCRVPRQKIRILKLVLNRLRAKVQVLGSNKFRLNRPPRHWPMQARDKEENKRK